MDSTLLTKAALGVGVAFAVAHFVKNEKVRAGCYGVIAMIVAKQVPFVKDAI